MTLFLYFTMHKYAYFCITKTTNVFGFVIMSKKFIFMQKLLGK